VPASLPSCPCLSRTLVPQPEYMPGHLLEESAFATLFPKYREKYLRQVRAVRCPWARAGDARPRTAQYVWHRGFCTLGQASVLQRTPRQTWNPPPLPSPNLFLSFFYLDF